MVNLLGDLWLDSSSAISGKPD